MALLALSLLVQSVVTQTATVNLLLSGVVYSEAHKPYDRLDKAIQMRQEAAITVVWIADSSWYLDRIKSRRAPIASAFLGMSDSSPLHRGDQ